MCVKFLHTADLHLGSQLKTQHQRSRQSSDVLDSAVYTAVERLFDTAVAEAVDFVIVAGDTDVSGEESTRQSVGAEGLCSRSGR
jgi:hypothetical protein